MATCFVPIGAVLQILQPCRLNCSVSLYQPRTTATFGLCIGRAGAAPSQRDVTVEHRRVGGGLRRGGALSTYFRVRVRVRVVDLEVRWDRTKLSHDR